MRIYVTGVTPSASFSPKRHSDYYDMPQAIVDALVDAGHEVDWGPPLKALEFGPDFVFAGFIDPRSMTANEVYDLAYVLRQLYEFDESRWCAYLPDWRINHFLRGVSYCARKPSYVERPSHAQREKYRLKSPDQHRPFLELIERWWSGRWPVVTASAFDWGSDDVMMKNQYEVRFPKLTRIDCTSYFPASIRMTNVREKSREWSYAVLWDYDAWMDKQTFTWPVTHLGATQYTRLPERKLLEEFDKRWGILSPPYDFRGSGLSRPRYKYAADLGCVLFTEPGELPGDAYNVPIAEIEDMGFPQLEYIADLQRSQLSQWQLTRHEVQRRLDFIAHSAETQFSKPMPVGVGVA